MSDLPGRDKSLDPDGYVYVFEFSTGHIKVGQTNNPRQRLSSHTHDAKKMGASVVQYWFSPIHRDYRRTEQRLIALMGDAADRLSGREYFTGCDFGAAVALAEPLIGRQSTGEERKASGPGGSFGEHFAEILHELRDHEARCAVEHVAVPDRQHRAILALLFDPAHPLPQVEHSDDWTAIADFCDLVSKPMGVDPDAVLDLNWIDFYEHLIGQVIRIKVLEMTIRAKEAGRLDLLEPFSAAFGRAVSASLAAVAR